jgi:hypothetical protein
MTRIALALAALCALGTAAEPLRGPCDMKSTEKKTFCPSCAAYVPRGDVKGGSCPKDKTRVETHDICIKSMYVPPCHPDKKALSPVKCCGVLHDKPSPDEARIFFKCDECMEQAFTAGGVKHKETCVAKRTKKTCEKSGMAPHSTLK